jgi:Ankyrin repeat
MMVSATNSDTTNSESTDTTMVVRTMTKNNMNPSSIPEVISPRRTRFLWLRWILRGFRTVRTTHETIQKNTKSIHSRTLMIPHNVSFLRLARERRFDEIIQYLQMDKSSSSSSMIYEWLQVHQESRSSTCECLHAICMYRPSAEVVQVVRNAIEIHSRSSNALKTDVFCVVNATLVTDASGRTPLHVAVACGCSYKVIDVLLHDDHEAVYMMDHTNRYPLHWACCFTPRSTNKPSQVKEIDNIIRIINRLMEIYAMAIICKDDNGCIPMDLAISHQADHRIIEALQFVTNILPIKQRKKSSKDLTFETEDETKLPHDIVHPHDITFLDDISSIGSRGVSKSRRSHSNQNRFRSSSSTKQSKRKNLNLIFI